MKAGLRTYVIGFALSIILTLIPFAIVMNEWVHGRGLLLVLAGFAVAQLFVQLQFFIHLGQERKPRWGLQIFLCALLVVFIVVGGSLWIMDNLDYHHMSSPQETNNYIQDEEGILR